MDKSKDQLQPHTWKHLYQKKNDLGHKNRAVPRWHMAPDGSEVQGQKVCFPTHGRWSYRRIPLAFSTKLADFPWQVLMYHFKKNGFWVVWFLHKKYKSMLVTWFHGEFPIKQLPTSMERWILLVISTVQLRQPNPTSPFMDAFGSQHPCKMCIPMAVFKNLCREMTQFDDHIVQLVQFNHQLNSASPCIAFRASARFCCSSRGEVETSVSLQQNYGPLMYIGLNSIDRWVCCNISMLCFIWKSELTRKKLKLTRGCCSICRWIGWVLRFWMAQKKSENKTVV